MQLLRTKWAWPRSEGLGLDEGPPTDTKLGCHFLDPLSINGILGDVTDADTAHGEVGDDPQTPTKQGQNDTPSFEEFFFYVLRTLQLYYTRRKSKLNLSLMRRVFYWKVECVRYSIGQFRGCLSPPAGLYKCGSGKR